MFLLFNYSDKVDINKDEIFISFFLSSSGNIQNFNKIPLNIKKYKIEKEKEEFITLGKCLIDMKYIINKEAYKKKEEDKNIGINIINTTNIKVNININNYNEEKKINKIISDIPDKINNLENYKEKKSLSNLINIDKKQEISDNNKNIKKEIKNEDKPVIIIDNPIKKDNFENKKININKNENFKIIDYIEINNEKEMSKNFSKNNYDTFCIGVVISGLSSPIQLSSLIEKSDNFLAPCGHSQCSMFPSIEPEILSSFLNKNSQNFKELSQLISNMCFPLGIKPCFGCKFTKNGIENSPDPQKTQQTFFNVIQKENGECFYIATLQYFIKMTNQEYIMKYRFNPVNYVLDRIKNLNNKDKKFKNNMQNISSLLNNSHVLLPESISLISKYPFFISMEKCLRSLISLKNDDTMDNLINHLINEVPLPGKEFQIQFFIPRLEKPIILNHQYNKYLMINSDKNNIKMKNNLLSSSQINMKILLEHIDIDNIIMIFQLLILEQKILFLENDYQILSEISSAFLELIYPLVWTNTFAPVLSTKTVRFLHSPVPFVMGIDEYLLNYSVEEKYINPEMIIFNIMTNKFLSGKTLKRIHKKEIFKEFNLPIISSKIREYIEKELKDISRDIKKQIKNSKEIDQQIRLVFLKSMIMLIGDYNNFIFYTNDEIPLFNKAAFIESHKDKTSQYFLAEMIKTQIFSQFLLNEKLLRANMSNKGQQKEYNFELVDTSYFKRLISLNQNLLNSEKIRSRAFSSKKIKKNKKANDGDYITNYIFNKNEKNNENNIIENTKGDINYSIDFSKGKNKIQLNSNVNISGAFSEKNDGENHFPGINNNKKIEKLISRAQSAKKIIQLKKPEKEEENGKEKEKEVKVILLYPYFLSKNFNNIDEITLEGIKSDIKEYAQKNNLKLLIQNSDHVFIRHNYKLKNVSQQKIYLYKKNNVINDNFGDNNIKGNIKLNTKDNKDNIDNKKEKNINYNKEEEYLRSNYIYLKKYL